MFPPFRISLLLVFIVIPLIEIALLIQLGQYIGVLWTILIVIATAVIGTSLLQSQGFGVLTRASDAMASGDVPVEPVVEGVLLLIAGAFLLTPGLLTDATGFILLIPFCRRAIARFAINRLLKAADVNVSVFQSEPTGPADSRRGRHGSDDGIIDGEYERVDERTMTSSQPGDEPTTGGSAARG